MLSMSKSLSKTSTSTTKTDNDIDIEELNRLATATFNTETLETCSFCGRTFLAEKLKIHNRSCTSDNPARKVSDNVKRGNVSKMDVVVEPRAVTASAALRSSKQTSSGNGGGDLNSKLGRTLKKAEAAIALACEEEEEEEEIGEVDSMSLGSTINLQVQNGSLALVGHLGGPAGRSLRRPAGSPSPSPSTSLNSSAASSALQLRSPNQQRPQMTPQAVRALQDKQDVVEYLADNISFMENTALGLMHSINDMKTLLEELRGGKV